MEQPLLGDDLSRGRTTASANVRSHSKSKRASIWEFPKIWGGVPIYGSFKGLLSGYYKGSFKGLYKGLDGLEFPKLRGTVFWGPPYVEDPTIQGTILRSAMFGDSYMGSIIWLYKKG